MLLKTIKSVKDVYKSINITFECRDNKYIISLNGLSVDNEPLNDDELFYDVLVSLMPGNILSDFYDDFIGANDLMCYSYQKQKDGIHFFNGDVYQDGLVIEENVFKDELDFYIYVFNKFSNSSLSTKELIRSGLQTPLTLFINFLKTKSITLQGFVDGSIDNDGYKYCAFDLKNADGKRLKIECPQGDFLTIHGNYLNFADFKETDVISYIPTFVKILESIAQDNIEIFFTDNSWL